MIDEMKKAIVAAFGVVLSELAWKYSYSSYFLVVISHYL